MNMTNEEMFEKNIRIAYKIANRYKINYLSEYEDIKQMALLGLWKAVLTFKNTHAFSTYAYVVIANEINHYLRKCKRVKDLNVSINTIVFDDLTLEDILKGEDNIEELLENIVFLELGQKLNTIQFTDTERKVIELSRKGRTQSQIAKELKTSQPRISRMKKNIKNKILKGINQDEVSI